MAIRHPGGSGLPDRCRGQHMAATAASPWVTAHRKAREGWIPTHVGRGGGNERMEFLRSELTKEPGIGMDNGIRMGCSTWHRIRTGCRNRQVRGTGRSEMWLGISSITTETYFLGFDAARGRGGGPKNLGLPDMARYVDERAQVDRRPAASGTRPEHSRPAHNGTAWCTPLSAQ